jgi:anaerobic selenocysteine-containing dehydrogenase
MNAATLQALGLQAGEWLTVSTPYGSASYIAAEAGMVDGVVSVEYGWWYPEEDVCEPNLGGIWRTNANLLTSGNVEESEPLIGTWTYNGLPCKVERTAS